MLREDTKILAPDELDSFPSMRPDYADHLEFDPDRQKVYLRSPHPVLGAYTNPNDNSLDLGKIFTAFLSAVCKVGAESQAAVLDPLERRGCKQELHSLERSPVDLYCTPSTLC